MYLSIYLINIIIISPSNIQTVTNFWLISLLFSSCLNIAISPLMVHNWPYKNVVPIIDYVRKIKISEYNLVFPRGCDCTIVTGSLCHCKIYWTLSSKLSSRDMNVTVRNIQGRCVTISGSTVKEGLLIIVWRHVLYIFTFLFFLFRDKYMKYIIFNERL